MNVKSLVLLLPLAALFVACSKDNENPEAKPILSLLEQPSIFIDTVQAAVDWVYGFKFKVNGDGIINKIGMKLPETGTFTARLWDLDQNEVLKEVALTATVEHEEVFVDFDDIPVTKLMTLGISITSNAFYKIRKTDNSSFAFPIETSTISILSFHEGKSSEIAANTFPLNTNLDQLSPCVDVVFIDQ